MSPTRCGAVLAAILLSALEAPAAHAAGRLDPALDRGGEIKAWVLFRRDKGLPSPEARAVALDELARTYDPVAIERRERLRTRPGLFDVDDLPLPERWLEAVSASGARIAVRSRWLHGVSVHATREELRELAELPFVVELRAVARAVPRDAMVSGAPPQPEPPPPPGVEDYGQTAPQLSQINLIALHELGYTGAGIRIGVIDSGFALSHDAFTQASHPIDVVAAYDFVDGDPIVGPEPGDLPNQHDHGTQVLGAIAGYLPGTYLGSAYDASFILAKAEDLTPDTPAEEDVFVAGLEFVEAAGAHVATSSLGQFNTYGPEDLDGETALITQAMNVAVANGVHVVQAAGNNGHDSDPSIHHLTVPADSYAISVGAVNVLGQIASFSSDGPTTDGRLKPEILARGQSTRLLSPTSDTALANGSGTSYAAPLVAGLIGCLAQAHPDWTPEGMRAHLFLHADRYVATGAPDPLSVLGFGIPDALATHAEDCNHNTVHDAVDLVDGTSGDCNANGILDECDVEALVRPDEDGDSLPDECTACSAGPGCPTEVPELMLTRRGDDVVLSWRPTFDAAHYRIQRADAASEVPTSDHAHVWAFQTSYVDLGAASNPPHVLYYLVRGVTGGGVIGP